MAYTITSNKKNASIVIHASANSGNVIVVGNSTVSNIASGNEIVTGAYISQIIAGSPSGNAAYWVIKRGANVVSVVDSSAMIDYAGSGMSLNVDAAANVVIELVGTTNGAIMIELQKQTSTSDYYTQPLVP